MRSGSYIKAMGDDDSADSETSPKASPKSTLIAQRDAFRRSISMDQRLNATRTAYMSPLIESPQLPPSLGLKARWHKLHLLQKKNNLEETDTLMCQMVNIYEKIECDYGREETSLGKRKS